MKMTKKNTKSSTPAETKKIYTPVPPQIEFPNEDPESKKNQQSKPGYSTKK